MADDKLGLDLDFDIKTKGQDKLDAVDKTLAQIHKSIEGIVSAAKAAGTSLDSLLGRGNRKAGGGSSAKSDTRSAKEALGIDRDAVRVLKMKLRYDQDPPRLSVATRSSAGR